MRELAGIKVDRCPLKIIPPIVWEYIQAYHLFKNGFLPNGEGWLKEPAKFISIMNLIEKFKEELEDAQRRT